MRSVSIEVIYALAQTQQVVAMRVPAGTSADEAVVMSGLLAKDGVPAFGLFGQRIPGNRILKEGDRVEILRPLAADPKDARRRRAKTRV
jgi:putative ubiquitin-RnfH superfamily antitoxin RatB of RatAB toxin-antitoxin module